MTSLMLCWYALFWVACGAVFARIRQVNLGSMWFCFIAPPFVIFALAIILLVDLAECIERIDASKQYLWRKNP
jgi:hypothetical protein